ncbi:hypothetical protein TW95_gp1466 [Pandoravirus inopinatum]|uniref:Uncharacterized protein n=1 Tax=Pandoravirus inopinatum TaxID=1605721 RepID=A0A0B5J8H1_9VIRU|nr:hypothetical protein TW95_gp1466 [Pandoravirus inopinatum]AJF98200.1 hypothetical protein [Pandoravirus inopinatum]
MEHTQSSLPFGADTAPLPGTTAAPAINNAAVARTASNRRSRPKPLPARPTPSMLTSYMVPEGTVGQPPVLRFVGSKGKRADTRRRAVAAAARPDPATLPAKLGGGNGNGGGVTTITTHVRVKAKGKRGRATAPPSSAGAPPVPDYVSPIHMFTSWYDHGDHDHDNSVSAHDAWTRMPATYPDRDDKWCRAYWERAYAREAHKAYTKRSHFVVGSDGRRVRIDMPAPGVPVTPTDEELAMAFYSDIRGDVVDPRDVVYGLWDQDLLDRWFRRSTRWCTPDADPVLDTIVRRRWVMGNHARYLCAWARPDVGVNARRIVRPRAPVPSPSAASSDPLAVAVKDETARATPRSRAAQSKE